jgi:hypothetical protein
MNPSLLAIIAAAAASRASTSGYTTFRTGGSHVPVSTMSLYARWLLWRIRRRVAKGWPENQALWDAYFKEIDNDHS